MTKAKVILLAAAATLRWQAPLPPWTRKRKPGEDVAKKFIRLAYLPVVVSLCGLSPLAAEAQFAQQGPKLVGTDAVGPAEQGFSVSLSDDGATAVIGGPRDYGLAGAAWVYTRAGNVWTQQAKLFGTGDIGVAEQGWSSSISKDGNTIIFGGPHVGAVWIFFRSGQSWTQQAKLFGTGSTYPYAEQGYSVSLSGNGNTAIIGGPQDTDAVGAAWIYTRSGGVWIQQAKLVGSDTTTGAQQGWSVSLSSDGNTAIVGGPFDGPNIGAAWVYTRSGNVWTQQAKLVGTNAIGNAAQGYSVSISGDGNTAIVGGFADNSNTGAAWVYTRSGNVWTQQAKLIGTDVSGPYNGDQGWSVSLANDGNTAILGGISDDDNAGAAWVFTRSGGCGRSRQS